MNELRTKAKKTERHTIEECTGFTEEQLNRISKRNINGIKIMSSHLPENRDGINDWFKRFEAWKEIN